MVAFNKTDLDFILQQIKMAEAGQPPVNPHVSFGLREVAGTNNSSVVGQQLFGSVDQPFLRLTDPNLRTVTFNADGTAFDPNPTIAGDVITTYYYATSGVVYDSAPRLISNLIADQTAANPAAVAAQDQAAGFFGAGYQAANNLNTPAGTAADGSLFINNVTPDNGLSAPFNSLFTFFGQFFDHGLDLISKGGAGTVMIPLAPDDPLITLGPDGIANTGDEVPKNLAFMTLSRASIAGVVGAGKDGVIGTADDVRYNVNTVTPFVDQSQTYTSHPSHQVYLREYRVDANGVPHATGRMLDSIAADGSHHVPTWADVKANALKLGILLTDADVGNIPMIKADAYGNFIPGANGLAQLVMSIGADGVLGTADDVLASGTLNPNGTITPIGTAGALRIGTAFINDMAQTASPFGQGGVLLTPDANTTVDAPNTVAPGTYDNELLDAHYVAGDGRINENIGLTSIHEIFHSEHNRLIDQIKGLVTSALAQGDTQFAEQWTIPGANLADGIQDNEWNGERLFQAAKFGTETQYQHLVFEEFARKIAPNIHLFGNVDITIDPAIMSEFANVVYRFGHSMLDENVNRYVIHHGAPGDPLNGTPEMHKAFINTATGVESDTQLAGMIANVDAGQPIINEIGLISAFTNPVEYAKAGADAAGQLIDGSAHQVGNEIDEFVTGALRNNLLGLPLDLAALNIARGRDVGVAGLNMVRNQIYTQIKGGQNDVLLKPYESWDDFGQHLRHPASLINFVAAYGKHVDITDQTAALDKRTAALDLVTRAQNTVSVHAGYLDGTSETNFKYTATVNGVTRHTDFAFVDNLTHKLTSAAKDASGAANVANTLNAVNAQAGVAYVDAAGHSTPVTNPDFDQDAFDFLHSTGQYVNNAASANAVHATWSTGSVTGLDDVDMWIGGLAEKQTLFGGLLGSTFDFIFKLQLENLQDADRLYYLPRIEGMHFGAEIEQNSFADMIRLNTGVKHLSASIFLTPEYTIEASTVTNDPATWLKNPTTGALLVEKLADGTVHFIGDDNFLGNTIVLGGTEGNDRLVAGQADDDTVWGDGGDDYVDGAGGDDFVHGGDGNDIVHGGLGADTVWGDAGDDQVFGDGGDDIMFGGDGNDFMDGGQGIDDMLGGLGNDIILGGEGDDEFQGNEGDDWLEGGAGGDVLVGDVGAPTGQVPLYAGNDVLIGGEQGDKMQGFSGDDIMLGLGGFDKFLGELGYDWASFEQETHGVSADMTRKEFVPAAIAPAGDAVRDIFTSTEGISGTKFDDILEGEVGGKADPLNELNNTSLILGLQDGFNGAANNFFAPGTAVHYSQGNIMLGGGGSDVITGDSVRAARAAAAAGGAAVVAPPTGGQDIIDGDAWLHVELIQGYKPGSQILREIVFGNLDHSADNRANDVDTAVYNDVIGDYIIGDDSNGDGIIDRFNNAANISGLILTPDARGFISVVHNLAGGGAAGVNDGTDLVRNIERLQFADRTIDLNIGANAAQGVAANIAFGGHALVNQVWFVNGVQSGTLTLTDPNAIATPLVGERLSISTAGVANFGITDADGIVGPVTLQWQHQQVAHPGWLNIAGATGTTFTPSDFYLGDQIRVIATYTDGRGFHEQVSSDISAVLGANPNVNHAPFIQQQTSPQGLQDTSATEDRPITNMFLPLLQVFSDDLTAAANLLYSATLAGTTQALDGTAAAGGLLFSTVPDGAGGVSGALITSAGSPGGANFAGPIAVTVKAIDAGNLSVTSTFTINVLPVNDGPAAFSVTGTPTEGQALTVALTTADPDGMKSPLSYQWLLDGAPIVGATTDTYKIGASDAGFDAAKHTISVAVSYDDAQGFHEVVTAPVPALNITRVDNGVAPITFAGTVQEGQTIRAVLGTDPDGAPSVAPTYVWKLTSGGTTTQVGTGATHVLTQAEAAAGATLTVTASYTDKQGFVSTSTETVPFIAPTDSGLAHVNITGAPAAGITAGVTLTAAFVDDDPDGPHTGAIAYQWAQDGTDIAGATGVNYTVGLADSGHALSVKAIYTDGQGFLDTAVSAPTGLIGPNAPPTFTSAATASIAENAAGAVAVTANDLNGDPLTFALAGADAAFFKIVAPTATGFTLAFVNPQDFEAPVHPNNQFTFDITASDGKATVSQTMTVSVTNVAGNVVVGTNGIDTMTAAGGISLGMSINGVLAPAGTIGATNEEDTITGGPGNDTLVGLAGNDTFNYAVGDGADTVNGGAGTDTLVVTGGAASDTLAVAYNGLGLSGVGGGTLTSVERVTVDLGAGTNTLTYTSASNVTVDLGAQTASGIAVLKNAQNVNTGTGNDTVTGDAAANVFNGGTGTDTYVAPDALSALTFAGTGAATSFTVASVLGGTDTLTNFEQMQIGPKLYQIRAGTTGANALTGTAADELFLGMEGADTFTTAFGGGSDAFIGGPGADVLNIRGISGQADVLTITYDGTSITAFSDGLATSVVQGVETVNVDLLAGGPGDTLSYSETTVNVTVNLATNTGSGIASIANVANVIGGAGADSLTGNANANVLTGGVGNDLLRGGAGNDTLDGGAGDDTAAFAVAVAAASFSVNAAGQIVVTSAEGTDTLIGIEHLQFTDATVNPILGTENADVLTGTASGDLILAFGGDDTIDGGAGADFIVGGAGTDTAVFASTFAAATFGTTAAGDLTVTTAAGGTDTLNGIEVLKFSDASVTPIFGTAGADVIAGTAGIDLILALGGNDVITGGAGNDVIDGAAGTDTAVYAGAISAATFGFVSATSITVSTATDGTDTLSNVEQLTFGGQTFALSIGSANADTFNGTAGADAILGFGGADTLNGGLGNDYINGGAGGDILIGGVGNDIIDTGAADDNVTDSVRITAAAEYGDAVYNFDVTGTAAQVDRVTFTATARSDFDDKGGNLVINWGTLATSANQNVAANLNTTVEGLFLSGLNGVGVANASLTDANVVSAAVNAAYNITANNGEDAVVVVNATDGNDFSVWRYIQAGGGETSATELTLIALVHANGDAQTQNFELLI